MSESLSEPEQTSLDAGVLALAPAEAKPSLRPALYGRPALGFDDRASGWGAGVRDLEELSEPDGHVLVTVAASSSLTSTLLEAASRAMGQ